MTVCDDSLLFSVPIKLLILLDSSLGYSRLSAITVISHFVCGTSLMNWINYLTFLCKNAVEFLTCRQFYDSCDNACHLHWLLSSMRYIFMQGSYLDTISMALRMVFSKIITENVYPTFYTTIVTSLIRIYEICEV